jgi:hypothetical protein
MFKMIPRFYSESISVSQTQAWLGQRIDTGVRVKSKLLLGIRLNFKVDA